MKTPHDVILRPVITEDSTEKIGDGKYIFEVARTASKPEIKKAVETLFDVKVLSVNTMHYQGKKKRLGVHSGRTPAYKKAVVTIDLDPEQSSYMVKGGKQTMSTKKYKTSIEEFGFGQ
jgi:large subunit ribosomal protein L23